MRSLTPSLALCSTHGVTTHYLDLMRNAWACGVQGCDSILTQEEIVRHGSVRSTPWAGVRQ